MAASRYGLEIRAAGPADAARLAELLAADGPGPAAAELADALDALRLGGGVALLAEEWGPPSGVIVLHWLHTLGAGRVAAVSTLQVAADARRRGIGRLLLKAGSQAARSAGCGTLQLLAPEGAAELEAFCRDTGFERQGRLWLRGLRKRG